MNSDILNLELACDFLSVSERTLIKLLREEHIPARKIGREWRFSKTALMNWISSGDSYEYANKEEKFEILEDSTGQCEILLSDLISMAGNLKDNVKINTLLKDVPEMIDIPSNITLRVSYKQKRDMEKLAFKLFWPQREEYRMPLKDK